jgi:hypothetical protein
MAGEPMVKRSIEESQTERTEPEPSNVVRMVRRSDADCGCCEMFSERP